MVNLQKLTAFFAYDMKSVAFKPVPTWTGSLNVRGLPVNDAQAEPVHPTEDSANGSHLKLLLSPTHLHLDQHGTKKSFIPSSRRDVTANTNSDCTVPQGERSAVADTTFEPFDQTTADVFRYRQQYAVNLGSWFVHEKWMTPAIFNCASGTRASEADISYGYGSHDNARAVLEQHWDTFIRESDFTYLSSIGINTVRLPIGYWCLSDRFSQGTVFHWVSEVYKICWPRVRRTVKLAADAGIGVLVDLHGAPGSQNGQQHSGISDGKTNLFANQADMDLAIEVLKYLTSEFAKVNNIVGIQLLNEPVYDTGLERFYTRAMDSMRAVSPQAQSLPLYLHDGFDLERFGNFVAKRQDFVVQDHHSYFVFTPSDQTEPGSQHIQDVRGTIAKSLNATSKKVRGNLIIGEWSCALTPQSLASENDASATQKEFCTEQMKAYNQVTAGWAFWAYKTDDCDTNPGWCFKSAVGRMLPSSFGNPQGSGAGRNDNSHISAAETDTNASQLQDDFMPTVAAADIKNLGVTVDPGVTSSSTRGRRQQCKVVSKRSGSTSTPPTDQGTTGRSDPPASGKGDPGQRSQALGYTDGKKTAATFASYNKSKLGFKGQFIRDAIARAGPAAVSSGTESSYEKGFLQGLKEGEQTAGIITE